MKVKKKEKTTKHIENRNKKTYQTTASRLAKGYSRKLGENRLAQFGNINC